MIQDFLSAEEKWEMPSNYENVILVQQSERRGHGIVKHKLPTMASWRVYPFSFNAVGCSTVNMSHTSSQRCKGGTCPLRRYITLILRILIIPMNELRKAENIDTLWLTKTAKKSIDAPASM